MIQKELIKYFEGLRDKCKDPQNKAAIQAEIDRLKERLEKYNTQGINFGNGYILP